MEAEKVNNSEPPKILEFSGQWEPYEEALFQIFKATIIQGNLVFSGLPVRTRFLPSTKGKHFTFWHLITEGELEEKRTPDFRRCERLSWIQWVLNNYASHSGISVWQERRKGSKDHVLWYEAGQYVVVLSKRSTYFLLKTAYYASKQKKIQSLQRERDQAKKQGDKS
jgi:hypothetical protein